MPLTSVQILQSNVEHSRQTLFLHLGHLIDVFLFHPFMIIYDFFRQILGHCCSIYNVLIHFHKCAHTTKLTNYDVGFSGPQELWLFQIISYNK